MGSVLQDSIDSWWTTERGLLPNLIRRERLNLKAPFLTLAGPHGIEAEYTYADFNNFANRAAWFLQDHLEKDEAKFYYMGRLDVRYYVWVFAAMKLGKCAIIPSPSNTVPANQLLFKDVGAKTLFHSPEGFGILSDLHEATKDSVQWIKTPTFEELMDRRTVEEEVPFEYTFDELKDKPYVALHTSGTTGHPKPIFWTHSALPVHAAQFARGLRPKDTTKEWLFEQTYKDKRVLSTLPFYHAVGMIFLLCGAITGTSQLIVPAANTKLSSENITTIINTARPDAGLFPPALLEPMLRHPPGLAALSRLKHTLYGGGPMNPTAGEKLAQVVPHLTQFIGSTEGAIYQLESTIDNSHWACIRFVQDMGQVMEEAEPGLFELVYRRSEVVDKTQLFFHSFPGTTEFRTKDLYAKVEGHPGCWYYRGRADNWIAMTNGLKFDPKSTEDTIGAHPDVSAVLVAGARRFRLCLLIELDESCYPTTGFASSEEEKVWRDKMLGAIWPNIQKANQAAPKFGRIPRELVLFASKSKPFMQSAKRTIQRQLTLSLYEKEIDELYSKVEQGLVTEGVPDLKSTTTEDLMPFLQELYAQTLEVENIGADEDFFSHGMDSFAVALVSSRLKAALRRAGVSEEALEQIGIRLTYQATTATQMAKALSSILAKADGGSDTASSDDHQATQLLDKYEAKVQELVDSIQSSHSVRTHSSNGDTNRNQVIAITGTTGSIGTYLLSTLLARSDVAKVICLNRAADAKERLAKSLQQRGLPPAEEALKQGRVVFMTIDIGAPNLGLGENDYRTLVEETTAIIHNAFPVNFLMTAQQFEPQFIGLLSLFEVVLRGKRQPALLFVSSVGATPAQPDASFIPEEVFAREAIRDVSMQGYGAAKFICERMAHVLSSATKARTAVLRVGQVAGPLAGTGMWNIWEWLPSIILSSKYLGVVPATIGPWTRRLDWVPVDQLAKIMSELVDDVDGKSSDGVSAVYNVVNPRYTTWDEIVPVVRRVVPEVVPFEEWLAKLEATRDASAHILDQNPAVKLVDFYRDMLGDAREQVFSTENLVRGSRTGAELREIAVEDMERWMRGWKLDV